MAVKLSPTGRVSFPSVFKPTAMEQGKDPKFQITLIFDKADPETQKLLAEMKAAAGEAVKKRWPNGAPSNLRNPFRDGNEKFEEKGWVEFKDKIFVKFSASEDRPPQVVDGGKRTITEASGQFYPGCWARVSYTCYAYDASGNKGVAFGLCNIQKIRDDSAFDSRSTADQDFDAVAGSETASGGNEQMPW
jgi:hypothetical protein